MQLKNTIHYDSPILRKLCYITAKSEMVSLKHAVIIIRYSRKNKFRGNAWFGMPPHITLRVPRISCDIPTVACIFAHELGHSQGIRRHFF